MSRVAHAINEHTVTCVVDGKVYSIQRDHPEAHMILRALREDWAPDVLVQQFNRIQAMAQYMGSAVEVRGNAVYVNGQPIHNVVADRILLFMQEDLPHKPLVKFLERLQANPSQRSVDQLYSFLEHEGLPITADGTFLAYKAVRHDLKDKHSGKFSNHIGNTLSMPRNKVDDDPSSACSTGFHVGSLGYVDYFACGYGSPGGDRIVIVEVDPADVVSVPFDSNSQKVRVCKYTVKAEYEGELPGTYVHCSSKPYDDSYDPLDVEEDEEDSCEEAWNDGYEEGKADGKEEAFKEALNQLRSVRDNA